MKTKDIIKTGIDRNFLRKCITEGIITPSKQDSDTIIHKNYIPQEFSQEDLEAIWYAYLCRKMGFTYTQIKDLMSFEKINLRPCLNTLIQKYEEEIEELQALVQFMRYVKLIGFISPPPQELMKSKKLKDYISDFMNYVDKKHIIRNSMNSIAFLAELDKIEDTDKSKLNKHISILNSTLPKGTYVYRDKLTQEYLKLKTKLSVHPASEEVQNIINNIYSYEKIISHNQKLSVMEFAIKYISIFFFESDLSVVFKKFLGDKTCNYYISALYEFLKINDPDNASVLFLLESLFENEKEESDVDDKNL